MGLVCLEFSLLAEFHLVDLSYHAGLQITRLAPQNTSRAPEKKLVLKHSFQNSCLHCAKENFNFNSIRCYLSCSVLLSWRTTQHVLFDSWHTDSHGTRWTLSENPFLISVNKYDLALSLKPWPAWRTFHFPGMLIIFLFCCSPKETANRYVPVTTVFTRSQKDCPRTLQTQLATDTWLGREIRTIPLHTNKDKPPSCLS